MPFSAKAFLHVKRFRFASFNYFSVIFVPKYHFLKSIDLADVYLLTYIGPGL